MDGRIALLLEAVERAYARKSWHGTTLKGALRGLTPAVALRRPATGRKCIWELALHAAYWKYIVRRALTGDRTASFPRRPSNWPAVPAPATAQALRRDLALLQEQHDLLCRAIRAFPPARLGRRVAGMTYAGLILGAAAHDTHHGGQVQLLKRL